MRKIKLYNSNLVTLVDDEDYDFLVRFRWTVTKRKTVNYALATINKKQVGMHQLLCPSDNPNFTPDHKDRNGLNNQRENLRLATRSQQQGNRAKIANCTSKYIGVRWHKDKKKWYAQIEYVIDGKRNQKHLGSFTDEKKAALAYNYAAKDQYGEFANLNTFEGVIQ